MAKRSKERLYLEGLIGFLLDSTSGGEIEIMALLRGVQEDRITWTGKKLNQSTGGSKRNGKE